jgi:NhaP-type Na+/H+ or K+/H+ antiporter
MLIAGIILGPYVLILIDQSLLDQGTVLRHIALVVILIRAGLSLDLSDLKKIGRPALFLSFVPALFEMIAITLIAPLLFHISYIDAAILGAIIAAVSPAVIVPRMIDLIHQKKGHDKRVPHMILAGASIDDIFVIVCFSALIQIEQGSQFELTQIFMIPISIMLGAVLGVLIGLLLVWFFKKFHIRDTIKVLIIFSLGFQCIVLENVIADFIGISGLVAIMAIGVTLLTKYPVLAKRLVDNF